MRKAVQFLAIVALLAAVQSAWAKPGEISDTYRRNSLYLLMMDDASSMSDVNEAYRHIIRDAFTTAPMPDKYNDHNLPCRTFVPCELTDADKEAYRVAVTLGETETASGAKPKKKKGGFGSFMKDLAVVAVAATSDGNTESVTIIDQGDKETYAAQAYKHLLEQQVAKQLFDKWFVAGDGTFTMDLVQARGLYNATEMDVQSARNSVRGMGMLADAGEELINNTFVVVSRYRYMSKEELVKEIQALTATAGATADALGAGGWGDLVSSTANIGVEMSLGEGYYVRTTSYLFQLRWNEDISNRFYAELWSNPEKYHASDIFSLKYIGEERAWANTKAGIFAKSAKPDDELVRIATINATDAVLAKLEKKYDVFKTKTPLLTVEPELTASIGMKEGLEPGDKYEVLEKQVDEKTGRTVYVRKGTLTVSKKKGKIWDNRYGVMDEIAAGEGGESLPTVTVFEGSKSGLYPGMLLRQIK